MIIPKYSAWLKLSTIDFTGTKTLYAALFPDELSIENPSIGSSKLSPFDNDLI